MIKEYNNSDAAIIIMAGGLGKRMNSNIPKVLHKINNKPMIVYILEKSIRLNVNKIIIIVGKYNNEIISTISEYIDKEIMRDKIEFVIQKEALGTGHAIQCCKNILLKYKEIVNKICILSGDVPLIKIETIDLMLSKINHANILVSKVENPFGYGRIILQNNKIDKIVEEKDCNMEEKKIDIINSGIYSFNIILLLEYIDKIDNKNISNEYYLTQIFEILSRNNYDIDYRYLDNNIEILGVNTIDELRNLEKLII